MHSRVRFQLALRAAIAIMVLFALAWLCAQALYFLAGGEARASGEAKTGRLVVANVPKSDREALATAKEALQEIGWWRDNAELVAISLSLDCQLATTGTPIQELYFWRRDQVAIATSYEYRADVEINYDASQLHYSLQDYGLENVLPNKGLDIYGTRVSSQDALAAAEEHGGFALRQRLQNQCHIRLDLSRNSSWSVDYFTETPFARLLCLDIDPNTGIVKEALRNLRPCGNGSGNRSLPPEIIRGP